MRYQISQPYFLVIFSFLFPRWFFAFRRVGDLLKNEIKAFLSSDEIKACLNLNPNHLHIINYDLKIFDNTLQESSNNHNHCISCQNPSLLPSCILRRSKELHRQH